MRAPRLGAKMGLGHQVSSRKPPFLIVEVGKLKKLLKIK